MVKFAIEEKKAVHEILRVNRSFEVFENSEGGFSIEE